MPPDNQVRRLAGLHQAARQRLIAVNGEAVAVTAIGVSQMGKDDDDIGAGGDHVIIVFSNSLNRILEAQPFGSRSNRDIGRLDGRNANETDLRFSARRAHGNELPGFDVGGMVPAGAGIAHLQCEVGSEEGEVRLTNALFQHGLAPVELVVAQCGGIIAHEIEQVNGRDALLNVGKQAALHNITGIEETHVGPAHISADGVDNRRRARYAGIATRSLKVAMEVIGVQNREIHDRVGR